MNDTTRFQNKKKEIRSRAQKETRRFFALLIILTILLVSLFYIYNRAKETANTVSETDEIPTTAFLKAPTQKTATLTDQKGKSSDEGEKTQSEVMQESRKTTRPENNSTKTPIFTEETAPIERDSEDKASKQIQREEDSPSPFDIPREIQGHDISMVDYERYVQEINAFYAHLDSQQYMRDYGLPTTSKEHFSKLIQKTLDNPPTILRETDDLFTLLKNTAHFFRILGRDNIHMLKGVLDRERKSLEPVLQAFYNLTDSPEQLKKAYGIDLKEEALYDYAAFFLHTMGGRLYLFRRDSSSRLVVSYYAVLTVDRAIEAGNSRHGIDLRPFIRSLIEEMENGGGKLKMREEYLDKLYDLLEKYN
ncbi:MAG: hypothetical protein CSA20_03445 [Deltaproteobacteria bacterium]|nr:MAG: hypothetical protein CSA20_03445 [Deltaproteobacteria bacterium]